MSESQQRRNRELREENAILRAQLAAAEERGVHWWKCPACTEETEARDVLAELRCPACGHSSAAARADAVREFAEWLKAHRYYIAGFDGVAARYLSSLGVPSARPDDAGRMERVRGRLAKDCNLPMRYTTWDEFARAVLAAADGEVKP